MAIPRRGGGEPALRLHPFSGAVTCFLTLIKILNDHACVQQSLRGKDVFSRFAQRLGGALREQRAACTRCFPGTIRRSGGSAVAARRKGTRSPTPQSPLLLQAVKCDPTTSGGRARRALPKVSIFASCRHCRCAYFRHQGRPPFLSPLGLAVYGQAARCLPHCKTALREAWVQGHAACVQVVTGALPGALVPPAAVLAYVLARRWTWF